VKAFNGQNRRVSPFAPALSRRGAADRVRSADASNLCPHQGAIRPMGMGLIFPIVMNQGQNAYTFLDFVFISNFNDLSG
jgi:hypothetical protein